MAEMIARYKPGSNVPAFCTALVRAGRFVAVSAGKTTQGDYSVAEAGAGVRPFGVAEHDSGPVTDPASSWTRRTNVTRRGSVARVIAGAAIAAGAAVASDAEGRAVTFATGVVAGVAMNATTAAGQVAEVDLI